MMDADRKTAQEVELDHLLAEEFACDPGFPARFLRIAGADVGDLHVTRVVAEPRLSDGGYGDLLVEGRTADEDMVLLIEDKITASPAVRQAARYQAHARSLRASGADRVVTVLVAPESYTGEGGLYDHRVTLEDVIGILRNENARRLEFRRGILHRALHKTQSSGVRIHDEGVHALRAAYLDRMSAHCQSHNLPFVFPGLKTRTYDGDSWIHPIRHSDLPGGMALRHRLWTSLRDETGQIDLIARTPSSETRRRFAEDAPVGAVCAPFSKSGIQMSIALPVLRPGMAVGAEVAEKVCDALCTLVGWYTGRSA